MIQHHGAKLSACWPAGPGKSIVEHKKFEIQPARQSVSDINVLRQHYRPARFEIHHILDFVGLHYLPPKVWHSVPIERHKIEEVSYRQVDELEQIKAGIYELVSLMKPKGSSVGGYTDEMALASTKDPRRPMHAIRLGKMKYGKVGGQANRSFMNNGEV